MLPPVTTTFRPSAGTEPADGQGDGQQEPDRRPEFDALCGKVQAWLRASIDRLRFDKPNWGERVVSERSPSRNEGRL